MKADEKRALVLAYLESLAGKWVSPTEVGIYVFHRPYYTASSYASPVCRDLCMLDEVERNSKGHYRIKS